MIKLISMVHKKPGLSNEEFYTYWKEKHGPLAAKIVPGLRKYTQNHVVKKPGSKNDCDGFAEIWFDNVEGFEKFLAWRQTGPGKELLNDEDKFIDRSQTVRYIVTEHNIV